MHSQLTLSMLISCLLAYNPMPEVDLVRVSCCYSRDSADTQKPSEDSHCNTGREISFAYRLGTWDIAADISSQRQLPEDSLFSHAMQRIPRSIRSYRSMQRYHAPDTCQANIGLARPAVHLSAGRIQTLITGYFGISVIFPEVSVRASGLVLVFSN